MRTRIAVIALVMAVLAACTTGGTPSPIPTQVLAPSTPTNTPEPPTATPISSPAPTLPSLPTAIPANLAGLADDTQRQMAQLAIDDLAQSEQVAPDSIQVAAVSEIRMRRATVDCSLLAESDSASSYPGFEVLLTAQANVYKYRTDLESSVRLCAQIPVEKATGETLVLIDPVAAQLFALTQRRLAEQLDLPMRRIHLVEMRAYTWPDSSLGCPVEGQSYDRLNIDGYRLVVTVGDNEYLFHTDFDRLVPCDPENEVLPEND